MFYRILSVFLLAAALSNLTAAKKPVTVDAVVNAPPVRHAPVIWAPDGTHFLSNEHGTLTLYDVKSGKTRDIVTMDKLESAAVKVPPAALFDWTNRRVGESDIQWFADGKRLLVSAGADLFIVDINKGRFDALTQTHEIEADPKLSPDNRSVSFRRGPDLFVLDIESKVVTQLTKNGSDTLLNGQLDWVYPEELDLGTAHWWSPDSRSIAYLQFDVSREPIFPEVSLLNPRAVLEPERYPQPGDPNAEVRLGIVPVAGGETKWMDLGDTRNSLLARIVWSPSGEEIMAERLNRVQNRLDLLMANVSTGLSRVVLHEEDPYWINVSGEPIFLGTGDRFLWTSERSGFRHIYLYSADGKLLKQLTSGEWQVDNITAVDDEHKRVFFTSDESSALERQLWSVDLDRGDGAARRLVSQAEGMHSISMAPHQAFYLDDYSSLTTPLASRIFRADGTEEREYHAGPGAAYANDYEILPTEIVKIKASDGTLLYARMIKPTGFDPSKKYPAVVVVYGGPDARYVQDSWQGIAWDQVLAQKGFVVWQLDNRGSTGRGHAFESVVYHDLGRHELKDQREGIAWLTSQGFVDPQRIGLYGWSYGGYMTLYTVTNAPGLIRAAVSGDPVTDWRNYDTIYTERYMGLPEENPEGYRVSATTTNAAGFGDTKLLMIHNIEDDNVHFQNSVQMAAALEQAGKQFDMLVYPQKTHNVSGPEYKQLLEEMTSFFEQNLK
jgi:dipeptidyl-peptidase-4